MNAAADLTVIILTLNEEQHIQRCVESALQVARKVYVVDSYSSDRTVEIAVGLGATVWNHGFVNHAKQLDWAMRELPIDTSWVMRLDCDEILSTKLVAAIKDGVLRSPDHVTGFAVARYVCFQGSLIRHGNFPQMVLRVWRHRHAVVEQRWMDEHVVLLRGTSIALDGALIDDNKNSAAWWIDKHNGYSSREAVDLLISRHFLSQKKTVGQLSPSAARVRWLKNNVYRKAPIGLRAFMYFIFRMVFQGGVLDGRDGFQFHFMQGCWYRYLVDIKVAEVERCMKKDGKDFAGAVFHCLGIDLAASNLIEEG